MIDALMFLGCMIAAILTLAACYIAGIFIIGIPMAKLSYKIWMKHYPDGGRDFLAGWFLFPVANALGMVGIKAAMEACPCWNMQAEINSDEFRREYIAKSASAWLLRLVWIPLAYIFVLAFAMTDAIEEIPNLVKRCIK